MIYKDNVLLDAIYWLFMNTDFSLYAIGLITFIALVISFLSIIRKWGDV